MSRLRVYTLFASMVFFWFSFIVLTIFLISALYYTYNMLKITEPVQGHDLNTISEEANSRSS